MKSSQRYIDKLMKSLDIKNLYLQIENNISELTKSMPSAEQEKSIIEILRLYISQSTSGDPNSRKVIKEQIKTDLQTGFNLYDMNENDEIMEKIVDVCKIDEANNYIDYVLPFNKPENLTTVEKFEILLYKFQKIGENGRDNCFNNLIEKYGNFLKKRCNNHYENSRYEINESDIDCIYKKENLKLSYLDKLEIVTQQIYEIIYGLKDIDILSYANVNEVGFSNNGEYVYVWSGLKYWLSFIKITEPEARVIQERAISFDKNVPSLDSTNPEVLCHRYDHARITATQPPYFSARNLCIRIFNAEDFSVTELLGSDKLINLSTALVRSGQVISFQGSLGAGKTTTMKLMHDILDDNLHIGTIEEQFEQHNMNKYPNKRVVEAQSIASKSLLDSVKTLLRMSIDVANLGEARDGEALFAFIQLVQSVSVTAFFTSQVISPEATVPRFKNMLVGTGHYFTEQSAIMDIAHFINIIFQHSIVNGVRVISEVVEIIPKTSLYDNCIINKDTITKDELERQYYLQQLQSNPCNLYALNTLLKYEDGKYVFVNYPSDNLINKARKNKEAWHYMSKLLDQMKTDLDI